MSSSVVETRPKAREVSISDGELTVSLADGRQDFRSLGLVPATSSRGLLRGTA